MNQDFIEKNKNDVIRIVHSLMVLFALIIGFNIGHNSISQELVKAELQIKELGEFLELDEERHQKELLNTAASCDQKINEAKLLEKQHKEKAFEDYKSICHQMKCDK